MICSFEMTSESRATGKTRHFSGGAQVPHPRLLKIAQYTGDPGFYLLHFGTDGEELTDTYHDSLGDAMAQAQFEFDIVESEWIFE